LLYEEKIATVIKEYQKPVSLSIDHQQESYEWLLSSIEMNGGNFCSTDEYYLIQKEKEMIEKKVEIVKLKTKPIQEEHDNICDKIKIKKSELQIVEDCLQNLRKLNQ